MYLGAFLFFGEIATGILPSNSLTLLILPALKARIFLPSPLSLFQIVQVSYQRGVRLPSFFLLQHMGAMFPWTKTTKAKSSKTTDVNVARPKEGIAFPAAALHAISLDHAYHKETEEKNQQGGKENENAKTKELDTCDDPDENIFDKLLCHEQSLLDADEQGIDDPKRRVSTVSEKPVETLNGEAKKKEIVDDGGRGCQNSISSEEPLLDRLFCREKSLLDLNEQNTDVPGIKVSTVKEKSLETLNGEAEKKESDGKVVKKCCSYCKIYKHNTYLYAVPLRVNKTKRQEEGDFYPFA